MGKDMSQAVSYYDMFDKDKQTEVVRGLSRLHLTVAAAESCTGGLIAARLTDVPGASAVFHCGVVSYSNEIKTAVLGVKPETLRDFSAVSAETPAEMADRGGGHRRRGHRQCRPRAFRGEAGRRGLYLGPLRLAPGDGTAEPEAGGKEYPGTDPVYGVGKGLRHDFAGAEDAGGTVT